MLFSKIFSKPMAVEPPIFIILYILSKPGGCIDTRYNIYALWLLFFKTRWQFYLLFILCCVCPWVWGHLGVWGELASHKRLFNPPPQFSRLGT